ncbi:PAS domain-containing sensor histidine kinase [Psychroflexus sp. ALD_RP9]|uniref:sensor histidine kinase n=1 Tax=Psychroflexus sp. ALD_RP9 TaxID=2777186 RepID=UPI001A8EE4C4|nr:HAMP domain-containing sensor histidine kinase [Psychroflexus sp. ALD_RP9]QSS96128.1 HAMP domain-containing histidine kinase [Psychroflexus sp. ALD_RP9]
MSPTKIIANYELLLQCNRQALIGFWSVNLRDEDIFWSDTTRLIHEVEAHFIPDLEAGINFFVEEDRPVINEVFHDCYNNQKPYDVSLRIKTAKGNLKHVRAIGQPLFYNDEIVGVHGTFQDISEQIKKENQFKEALLIASEQNYKLKSFNHIISHNLKSTAGNISSLLTLMKMDIPEIEEHELFDKLVKSSNQLTNTLKELNDLLIEDAKIKENKVSLNLYHLTNDCFEELEFLAQTNQVVLYNQLPKDLTIISNVSFVKSIFYNLINNAIKYRDDRKAESKLEISLLNENKHEVNLSFKDNGMGIDLEKHRDRIFNAYTSFHTNKNIESRGLGLFMVKNQVETLQGRIFIESDVNKGTHFKVRIPKA